MLRKLYLYRSLGVKIRKLIPLTTLVNLVYGLMDFRSLTWGRSTDPRMAWTRRSTRGDHRDLEVYNIRKTYSFISGIPLYKAWCWTMKTRSDYLCCDSAMTHVILLHNVWKVQYLQVRDIQCDQICQNFATFEKLY